MRLIDADVLRQRMYHDAFETDSDMQKWDGGCWVRYKMFENAIEDAPTIDPVKHGRWTKRLSVGGFAEVWEHKCSECGCVEEHLNHINYCPNCGAKMDEVSEDASV